MKRNHSNEAAKLAFFAMIALAGGAFAGAPACTSESNAKPPGTTSSTGDSTSTGTGASSSATAGTGGATATSSSSATGTGGAGTGGKGTGGSPATGTGGSDAGASCDGANGCYSCPPTTDLEHLNACTGAQCSPFDNVARLPNYNNGNLPAVP